jgi:serine/threonine protein phosphatase PrpC
MGELMAEKPPREAAELLVAEARRRAHGGGDNISIVIVKLEPLPTEA